MRFKKKKNVLTGEDDYELETRRERETREAAEIVFGIGALLFLIGGALFWVVRGIGRLFTRLLPSNNPGHQDGPGESATAKKVEHVVYRGMGVVAYAILAILGWPLVIVLGLLPNRLMKMDAPWLDLILVSIGSVAYFRSWYRAVRKRMSEMDADQPTR